MRDPLSPDMSNLRRIIQEEIACRGTLPFDRFMELALYCPNFGYYERQDKSPGRRGDYFTSVSVGPLFGELLAWQFITWRNTQRFQILEAGAHDGQLARDILCWLRKERPDAFNSIEYWILEPSSFRRLTQETTLVEFSGHVRWFEGWSALPSSGVNGVIFSNELLDAMPVRRLGWDSVAGKWFEWGVAVAGDEFVWSRISNPEYPIPDFNLPPELLSVLPNGFTTEICPAATDWWTYGARVLKRGRLIAFDYGSLAEQFFTPKRIQGTLRAYYQHHAACELLARPGEQDLTAHVNFTPLIEAGESVGLRTEGLVTQAQFLTCIADEMRKENPPFGERLTAHARQFQTLTHPEHLGHLFRVLTQQR